jgi:hypothetical protein
MASKALPPFWSMSDPILEASTLAETTIAFSVITPVGIGVGTFLQFTNRTIPSKKPAKRIIDYNFGKKIVILPLNINFKVQLD